MQKCKEDLLRQEQELLAFSNHEEVVLWFEHDLFCQTILIHILNRLSQQDLGKGRLSLVCIDQFPDIENFRGLGQLSSDQMSSLFASRHPLTKLELGIAAQAWNAYSSPSPKSIENLMGKNISALPFLKDALLCHLARFPSLHNGLGRIEHKALELICAGHNEFIPLFNEFGMAEPLYGLGDFQFWNDLKRLVKARQPLIIEKELDDYDRALSSGGFIQAYFEISDTGQAVLTGNIDFVKLAGVDLWLGGVHLQDKQGKLWRWDEQSQRIELGDA